MHWKIACKLFDDSIFENYNLFCVFMRSVSTVVLYDDSTSKINQLALWINGVGDFPAIKNKALVDKLQSILAKCGKYNFVLSIRGCLDELKSCFEDKDKRNWGTTITNTGDVSVYDVLRNFKR